MALPAYDKRQCIMFGKLGKAISAVKEVISGTGTESEISRGTVRAVGFPGTAKKQKTREWYESVGWRDMCKWVTELSGRGIDHIYIQQFEFIPDWTDLRELCVLFNEDSYYWKMSLDTDGMAVIRPTNQ